MNPLNRMQRWLRLALGTLALVMLASCGGGDRLEPFRPNRIFVFGDGYSSIAATTGVKHSLNAAYLDGSTTKYECAAAQLWHQYLIYNHYNKDVDACLLFEDGRSTAKLFAEPQWKVNDVLNALSSQSFQEGDLVMIFVGANDVLAAGATEASLRALGAQLGGRIKQVIDTKARVLIVTVPDLGKTPTARTQGRESSLTALARAFNDGLCGGDGIGYQSGYKVALLQADALVYDLSQNTSYNLVDPACPATTDANPETCNDIAGAPVNTSSSLVWAWDIWFNSSTQSLLGQRAVSQVDQNWE